MDIRFKLQSSSFGEPEDFVYGIKGDIYSSFGSEAKERKVGTLRAQLVDLDNATGADVSVGEVFDSVNDALAEYYGVLFDDETEIRKEIIDKFQESGPLNILILDRIEIQPRYRGRGFALGALYETIRLFGGSCGYAVLKAFPLQFEGIDKPTRPPLRPALRRFSLDKRASTKKLFDYYSKLGFRRIGRTEFMLLNLSFTRPVPSWSED